MNWIWSFLIFLSCNSTAHINTTSESNMLTGDEYVELSKTFLTLLRNGENADNIVKQYKNFDLSDLIKAVDTQEEKLAFWINTYNAYVQYLLIRNPELFDNRGNFFTKDRFVIAGQNMSFDRLEHGIIRNSRIKYGLGYIKKWFPPKYERKLRIKKRDGRVHFALNCGAKTCPPIAIFDHRVIHDQLDTIASAYLLSHTQIASKQVTTSPLFSWFRGDFGGKKGIKKILKKYNVISTTDKIDLKFGDYDWTLSIGNYTDL